MRLKCTESFANFIEGQTYISLFNSVVDSKGITIPFNAMCGRLDRCFEVIINKEEDNEIQSN